MPHRSAAISTGLRAVIAVLIGAGGAHAQGTISDPPAAFSLGPDHFIDASADLTGVSVPLETDHLFAQGWWYRLAGDGVETFLAFPDDQTYDGAGGTLTWQDVDGRGFAAVEVDTITNAGGPAGRVTLALTVTNLSDTEPLEIDVFHMADIDVGGASNDAAVLAIPGLIRITDAADTAEYYGAGSSAFLVSPSGATDVATVLFDALAEDFGDTGLPFGPGDVTAGFQWQGTVIPPSESETFTVVIALNTAAVPGVTPTTTTTTPAASTTTTLPPVGETCGDCQDGDGDGLVDFEDPDCCPAVDQPALVLTKGKLLPRGTDRSSLSLAARLPASVLTEPFAGDVAVQVRRAGAAKLLCARIPSTALRQKKQKRVFRDPNGSVASASGLDRVTIAVGKRGEGKLVAHGGSLPFALPDPGSLTVILGLPDAAAGGAGRCAVGSGEFRAKRKGIVLR